MKIDLNGGQRPMDVTAALELNPIEQQELAAILNCRPDQLETKLKPFASAALFEYASMMLGQKVFRRGSDILEYRLYLLIKDAFNDEIPDEQEVCKLFQITANESRSLIRSVMSKYQYQLRSAIETSMRRAVESATASADGESFIVTINSRNVVDALNVRLATRDGSLQPVSKRRGSVSEYEISPASHQALREELAPISVAS